jgi:Ca2+-binding RTX toxin-like protein
MQVSKIFTNEVDHFVVGAGDDFALDFRGGNDVLVIEGGTAIAEMGAGDDFVRVEGGSARLYGQDGADRFDVYSSARVNGGEGNDLFNFRGGSHHGFAGRAGDDRFNFLSDATGVRLAGDDGNDLFVGYSRSISGELFGGDGNDRFIDFGSFDGRTVTLHGGAGNDLYRVDASSPAAIVELSNEGIDTVQLTGEYSEVSYTLGANLENLNAAQLPASNWLANLTGNSLGNSIIGSPGYDNIFGLAGNDRIHGGASGDYIEGGEGNDRITGGLGVDYVSGGPGRDVFFYESVADANETDGWGIPDWIGDWEATDRIDLSGVDANSEIAGNQAFEFAGAYYGEPAPFSGAGTLNIGGFGGELYITGHTDSDGDVDFIIGIWSAAGESALSVDNLIL